MQRSALGRDGRLAFVDSCSHLSVGIGPGSIAVIELEIVLRPATGLA